MNKFSRKTKEELKYYVYALTYKEDGDDVIFYIGKGKNDRVFSHFNEARKIKLEEFKQEIINDKLKYIVDKQVDGFILNAGLTESEALMIEATLINTMRRFKKQTLTNLVKGHKSFDPENINAIDFKYSEKIQLEDFAKKHGIKILVLKSTEESYYSAIDKDLRGVLEGIWKLSSNKMNEVDYVLGVLKSGIYGVYKYVKGSYKKIDKSWSQDELDHWNSTHISMGRPIHYYYNGEDGNIQVIEKKNKGVMKLSPIAIPESQKVIISNNISEIDKKIAKQLINRTIADDKMNTPRTGRLYFGFDGK